MSYFYSPFRKQYQKPHEDQCPFCDMSHIEQQVIRRPDGSLFANEHYYWAINFFPKFEGHTMLLPKRHIDHPNQETEEEILSHRTLLNEAIVVLQNKYPNCGVEYFFQTGPGSQGSVNHLHWHLLPAYPDDNLRSFEKMGHFYTTEPDEEKVLIFPQTIKMSPSELLKFLSQP